MWVLFPLILNTDNKQTSTGKGRQRRFRGAQGMIQVLLPEWRSVTEPRGACPARAAGGAGSGEVGTPGLGARRGGAGTSGRPQWPGGARQVSATPSPLSTPPGFPLGSGFPVSVLGDLQQQVLVCQARLPTKRRRGKEEGRRKRRRSGCGCGCGRAGRRGGEPAAGRAGSPSSRSSAGGGPSRGPGRWPARAGGRQWGSLPLARRPSSGLRLKERRPPASGSWAAPASRACGDGR